MNNENIINLIKNPKTPVIKPPLYRSMYADSVRRDYMSKKDCHRTMGLADVYVDPPSQYLKKKSKPTVTTKPFVGRDKTCTKTPSEKRPALGQSTSPKIVDGGGTRTNIIRANIIDVKRKVPPLPKHRMQDTRTGHVLVLDEAGLEPTYVLKDSYGKLPVYLKKRNKEKEIEKQKEEERKRAIKPPLRQLPDDEKQEMLNGLKYNWAELNKQFLMLPMFIDTDIKRRKKERLEKQLTELEKDIKLLEDNSPIYVCQGSV